MGGASFLIVGVNHRTGPQLLRERLQGDAGDVLRLLGRCREAGIDQAMGVATCDRCEIWCVTEDVAAARAKLPPLLAEAAGMDVVEILPRLHQLADAAALPGKMRERAVGIQKRWMCWGGGLLTRNEE